MSKKCEVVWDGKEQNMTMNLNGLDFDYPFGNTTAFDEALHVRAAPRKPQEAPDCRGSPGDWRYPSVRGTARRTLVSFLISGTVHAVGLLAFNLPAPPAPAVAIEEVQLMEIALVPPEPEEVDEVFSDGGAAGEEGGGVEAPQLPDVISTVLLAGDFLQAIDQDSFKPRADVAGARLTQIPGVIRAGGKGGVAGHGLKNLFNLSDLDKAPEAVYQPPPSVPPGSDWLSRAVVVVGFVVTSSGQVVSEYVISSEDARLDASALKGIARWKFKAGVKGGKRVNTRMQQPIVFNIE